jgi:hypothetical protein
MDDARLGPRSRGLIGNRANEVLASLATLHKRKRSPRDEAQNRN